MFKYVTTISCDRNTHYIEQQNLTTGKTHLVVSICFDNETRWFRFNTNAPAGGSVHYRLSDVIHFSGEHITKAMISEIERAMVYLMRRHLAKNSS